jgi:DNA-directed RNA polymerase specialized sigma24 family protein
MGFTGTMWPARTAITENAWEDTRSRLMVYFLNRHAADAEDLTHETLRRVWSWLGCGGTLSGGDALRKLCYGFARLVWAETRKERRATEIFLRTQPHSNIQSVYGLTVAESRLLVRELLASLPDSDRQLVLESAVDNEQELAMRLGISIGALRVRLHRTRARLRQFANCSRPLRRAGSTARTLAHTAKNSL